MLTQPLCNDAFDCLKFLRRLKICIIRTVCVYSAFICIFHFAKGARISFYAGQRLRPPFWFLFLSFLPLFSLCSGINKLVHISLFAAAGVVNLPGSAHVFHSSASCFSHSKQHSIQLLSGIHESLSIPIGHIIIYARSSSLICLIASAFVMFPLFRSCIIRFVIR